MHARISRLRNVYTYGQVMGNVQVCIDLMCISSIVRMGKISILKIVEYVFNTHARTHARTHIHTQSTHTHTPTPPPPHLSKTSGTSKHEAPPSRCASPAPALAGNAPRAHPFAPSPRPMRPRAPVPATPRKRAPPPAAG